jgi:hypothetical protein
MRHDAHYVDQLIGRAAPHTVRLIPTADIDGAGRIEAAQADVERLASSMRDVGVLQPLLVRPAGGRYELIAGARRLAAARVAGLGHVPCIVHDTDDAMVENIRGSANLPAAGIGGTGTPTIEPYACLNAAVALDLAESLEAASACLTLNTGQTRGTFTGRVAKELLGIELHRARRLARAAAYLSAPYQPSPRDLLISGLMHDVVTATEAPRRMLGVKMDVAIADRESWMRADSQLLTLAFAGTADAMLSQMDGPGAMRLAVRTAGASATVSVEISMTPAPDWAPAARLFGSKDVDHPWGASAGLLLAAAARVADVHGGHVDVRSPTADDCTIVFVLPRR